MIFYTLRLSWNWIIANITKCVSIHATNLQSMMLSMVDVAQEKKTVLIAAAIHWKRSLRFTTPCARNRGGAYHTMPIESKNDFAESYCMLGLRSGRT